MSPSMASGGDWYMRRTRSRQGVSLTRPMLFHHWEQRLPVPYTWLRQLECLLPAPARRKPGEVGRRSPAQVGDRSGMIPRHAPRPPLPACPLSHRPRPGQHPIRCPAPSRGAGAASPAPRSGAESRQASLAAGGSPPARRLDAALAAIELGCPATQTGEAARWHRELVRRKWAAFARRQPRPVSARHRERWELVLRLAQENPSWGYRRIQGEALKLGFKISHMGVAKILRRQRIPPAPRRAGHRTWREFVRQHAAQMLACDFFTVETVWLQRLHVLFFIEIASRKVHLADITANPTGEWVAQQARSLAWRLQDGALKAQSLLRDRDSKFTVSF